jgi:protein-disulfide isomerase
MSKLLEKCALLDLAYSLFKIARSIVEALVTVKPNMDGRYEVKKLQILGLILLAAFVASAIGCNTSGLTPEQAAEAKMLADLGVKMPNLEKMSAEEKEVYKHLLNSSGEITKDFVKFLGDNAKEEEKFTKIMKGFDKRPLKTLAFAARPKRKEQEKEDPNKIYKVDMKFGEVPSKGSENAPIIIYEFSEFQCPFCKRGANTINELMDKYGKDKIQVRYVMRILPFHKKAPAAAAASYAAWKQNKFWEFHDHMWENQKNLGDELYMTWAKENGMDMAKFTEDMKVEKWQEEFDRLGKIADGVGVRGVPTFLINGKKLRGAKPTAEFVKVIDEILKGK